MSSPSPPLRFRHDCYDVLRAELAQLRMRDVGCEVRFTDLSPPHPRSPFFTLAEHRGSEELASHVIKLLMLPDDYNGAQKWSAIQEEERKRLEDEFRRRLQLGSRLELLRLPLTRPQRGDTDLVSIRALRSLTWSDLIEGEAEGGRKHPVLHYLLRPYIPWPTLTESGLSRQFLDERWKEFCDGSRLPVSVHDDPVCRTHFFREALVAGTEDLLLVSAWRWKLLARGTQ